jgi:hypothetical protein
MGKADPAPVPLYIWADDVHPQFCPVRHFLTWIALSGITSGAFFPNKIKTKKIEMLRKAGNFEPIHVI